MGVHPPVRVRRRRPGPFPLFAFVFLVAPGHRRQHFPDDPGPGRVGALRHPPRDPARISGHRRGDHLRRCGAGGHLHRPGCAPAGFLAELGFAVAFGVCWTPSSCGPCWSQPWPTTSARPSGGRPSWPQPASRSRKPGRPPRTRPPADAMTTTTPRIRTRSARPRPTPPTSPDGSHGQPPQSSVATKRAPIARPIQDARPRLTRRTTAATHTGSCPAESAGVIRSATVQT